MKTAIDQAETAAAAKHCVICGSTFREFRPFASRGRLVQCPVCKSIDRNRLLYLYLKNETDIFADRRWQLTGKTKLLHVAPEKVLGQLFSKTETLDYYPVDIDPARPFVREAMDIKRIKYEENSFDYIICSHVLEHIDDDRAAMRNLARVLKPSGRCLILVPLKGEITIEDAAYNTDELRRLHYGGVEHVRYYGLDIVERLKACGLSVEVLRYSKRYSEDAATAIGLSREPIFVCRKSMNST